MAADSPLDDLKTVVATLRALSLRMDTSKFGLAAPELGLVEAAQVKVDEAIFTLRRAVA